jgi:hypothetical protein
MSVNLSPLGGAGAQFFTNDGVPLTGGLLYTYLAGTSTPATTYTSGSGVTALANPIILDAAGRVPTGEIWLSDGISYKFVLKDSTDVLIATWDGLSGINSNFIAYTSLEETATATAGQTVFNLTIDYIAGANSLAVFVNGSNQIVNVNYTETDSNTVTFITGLNVGDVVKFSTATPVATNAMDAANVSYTPAGVGAVTTNVQAKLRETVSVKDFGAVGDGVTDDTAAIQAAIDVASNTTILFPAGEYKITDIIYARSAIANAGLVGEGNATITGSFGYNLIQFCQTTDFTINNIIFDNQYVNAADGSASNAIMVWTELEASPGSGTYQDCNIENVTVENCTFTMPSAQAQGIFVAFRTVQNPATARTGLMKNLAICNNKFIEIGSIGITIMNRQTSSDRYSCVAGIRVENNYFKDLAFVSAATYGMALSLDGFGQDFYVNGNSITGHKSTAIEVAGWINGLIQGNNVYEGKTATTYRMFTLDGGGVFSGPGGGTTAARVSQVRVIGNACIADQTIFDYIIGADNCVLSDNIHRTGAAPEFGAMQVYDATYVNISNSQFISNNRAAIQIGTGANVTTYINLQNCVFDNSTSAASTATVYFTGSGTTNNSADGVIDKAATGVAWSQASSATNNSVNNLKNPSGGVYTPTLTNTTNITSSAAYPCSYFRVDDSVTVFGRVDVTPTTSSANTDIQFSLPIASNFTQSYDGAGVGAPIYPSTDRSAGIITVAATDVMSMRWVTSDNTLHAFYFSFSYKIQ